MLEELQFETLTWQQFERMIASLLEAEGFVNVISAGGSGGDMGLDISADEMRRSLSGRISSFRWMVQTKHYAGQPAKKRKSKTGNVGHQEITDILSFLSEHKAQGFLLITDTDLTSEASKKITAFHEDQRHQFEAHFWNRRTLSDRLRKHPDIVARYFSGIENPRHQIAENPFKFLESFKANDRYLFFGRNREIRDLAGLVCNAGLVVLFGESGTGKTSLLNAGLLPQMADMHFFVTSTRCLEAPSVNIRREVLRTLQVFAKPDEILQIGSTADLSEFFRRVLVFLDSSGGRMVVALDQFEEVFTRAGEHERDLLADAVRVLNTPNISHGTLTLILSIREDYLGSLWEWSHKQQLTEAWGNAYRISRMNVQAAESAITSPLSVINKSMESNLVSKLLSDLEKIGDGKVYPPYIQIVCGSLVDQSWQSESIGKTLYDQLGGAESIIGDYLDNQLFVGLSAHYAELARLVLDTLTGGQGLRTLLSRDEIQAYTGISESKQLEEIIEFLVQRRIVAPCIGEDDKIIGYELIHDFLSRRFFERLKPSQKRERAIRDVFRRAFNDWKRNGILISKSALDEFYAHRDILYLNEEQLCMIIESAFASGKYAYWRNYISKKKLMRTVVINILKKSRNVIAIKSALKEVNIFLEKDIPFVMSFLKNNEPEIRRAAVNTVRIILDKGAVKPLLGCLEIEKEDFVSGEIANALGQLGDNRAVEPLIISLKVKGVRARGQIADALGQLGDKRAVKPLIKCLGSKDYGYYDDTLRCIANALGKLGDKRAVEPLIKCFEPGGYWWTNSSIVDALAELGDKRSVEPLIKWLRTEDDEYILGDIVEALGKLGDKLAIKPLKKILKSAKNDSLIGKITIALNQLVEKDRV